MQGLIGKLFYLTQSQWIFLNITKYHHKNGTIKLDAKQDVIKEIKRQLDMGLCNLPTESKRLLKIDTSESLDSKIESQQYWLYKVKVDRIAGEGVLRLSSSKTAS